MTLCEGLFWCSSFKWSRLAHCNPSRLPMTVRSSKEAARNGDSHFAMHCGCMAVSSDLRPVATEELQIWLEAQHVFDDPEPQTLLLAPAQPAQPLRLASTSR